MLKYNQCGDRSVRGRLDSKALNCIDSSSSAKVRKNPQKKVEVSLGIYDSSKKQKKKHWRTKADDDLRINYRALAISCSDNSRVTSTTLPTIVRNHCKLRERIFIFCSRSGRRKAIMGCNFCSAPRKRRTPAAAAACRDDPTETDCWKFLMKRQ